MSQSDFTPQPPDDDVCTLIAALCDGTADQQQVEQLETRLRTDPAAKAFYLRFSRLHAALQLRSRRNPLLLTAMFKDLPTDAELAKESAAGAHTVSFPISGADTPESPLSPPGASMWLSSDTVMRSFRVLFGTPRHGLLSAVAAILMLASLYGGLALWQRPRSGRLPVPIPLGSGGVISPFLATLTGASNCVWQGGVMPTYEGARLPAGTLRLERGIAEITFDDGARVLLEGPAQFEIMSTYSGFLYDGRLVARVASSGAGFMVQTPVVQVVDLGTEFGVDVSPLGAVEVFCFEGLIEMQPMQRDGEGFQPRRLTAGELGVVQTSGAATFNRPDAPPPPFVRKPPKHTPAAQRGQVVNIDFGTSDSPKYRGLGVYSGPGGEAANRFWNHVDPGDEKSAILSAANGDKTAVTITYFGTSPWYTVYSRMDHALLDDYIVVINCTGRFVIGGLMPGERYDLYLFGTSGTSNAEQHEIGYGAAEGALFTIGSQTKATLGLRRGNRPFTIGKDYVVFEGVEASADGEIRGTWSPNPQANSPANNSPYGILNGMQIVGPMIQATESSQRRSSDPAL